VHVEVYADADEVELLLDGEPVGHSAVGTERTFRADFELPYRAGTLVAVAYRDGAESGRTSLKSASKVLSLTLTSDRDELEADTSALAFVDVTLIDDAGIVQNASDREVRISVTGAGVLQGFGSAAPVTDESFHDEVCRTFDGRAIAVIRPTEQGTVTLTAEAEGCEPVQATLTVTAPMAAGAGPSAASGRAAADTKNLEMSA
jgi:beta-galactosidase